MQAPTATPAPKQEAKVEEIKPKKKTAKLWLDLILQYAVATTGVAVGLLAGLFGFKKRNNLQK